MVMTDSELHEHYKRIIEISQQLSTMFDHMALLNKIVSAACELINTEAASIMLLDDATKKLRFALSSNIKPHEMEEIQVPLEGSYAGWIFTHGEPRVIEDVTQDTNHFQGVDNRIGFHTRNLLGVPMRTHKRVIGVVQVVNKLPHGAKFSDNDILTLQTLASQAGIAIENARLFQQSDFIAEMVHELRTPLAALKASATLLQRSDLPTEKRSDIVETMRGETDRLIVLTNDFLDVARLESGRTQLSVAPFEVYKLLAESADVVHQQAHDKSVTIRIAETDIIAEADRGKVKQVLLNLLTNAIKYNRPGGKIVITTKINDNNDANRDDNPEAIPFLTISVQDTGYGISKDHQKNMFQKFYRVPSLEKEARGTGLGLAISKHIVEAHGGRIWLDSEEGVGSTFSFSIPLAQV